MLDVLREKQPPANLTIVQERMERFDLGERRFRLITAPFRAFSHLLDVDAQLAAGAQLHLRWFYRYEVEHLLARAGFTQVDFFGDFNRGSWNAEGETVIVARSS